MFGLGNDRPHPEKNAPGCLGQNGQIALCEPYTVRIQSSIPHRPGIYAGGNISGQSRRSFLVLLLCDTFIFCVFVCALTMPSSNLDRSQPMGARRSKRKRNKEELRTTLD